MKRKPKRGKELPFEFPFKQDHEIAAFDGLVSGLKKFSPDLSEEVMLEVASYCSYLVYEKDAVLVDYGEVCEHVYFTLDGMVTALEKEDGKEEHCWFMTKGDVVIAIDSYFLEIPSKERLVTLKEYACIALPKIDLKMLSQKNPEFMFLDLLCTQHYYMDVNMRFKWGRLDATSRYKKLKEHYPHLTKEENVTNTALASFLGISREHLNRIRKEIDE